MRSREPGAPVEGAFIPLSVPEIRGNEWKYVKECLDTGWISSVGFFVDRFERMVADYVGASGGVATCSGTAALHTALLVAGISAEDEVLASTLSFIAPANAIRYCGAWPVFIDAEPDHWQMDPQKLSEFLRTQCVVENGQVRNKRTGRRVKAILPVHVLGHPCDMDPIVELARAYDLTVIEDATESLGAQYRGHMVGRLGDTACFSFNGNKIISTGGGGMMVTNNAAWAERARYLTTQAKHDPVEYIHKEIGYNYRLTNIQAAVGCAQLERLDDYVTVKRRIARRYGERLGTIPGILCMAEAPWARSAFWMYTVLVDEQRFGMTSRELMRRLQDAGIQSRPLWEPLHLSAAHRGTEAFRCEVALNLYRQALSLPCSVGLTEAEQRKVIEAVEGFAGGRR